MSAASIDFTHIEVRGVTRQFGRRRALAKVSFRAASGDLIALLGPNGAGKSTLLAVLATLVRPTHGDVRYGEMTRDSGGDALRGAIGYLGHELFLYSDLTARENLAFAAGLAGGRAPTDAVARALDAARLTDRADERVSVFSRGMRQRLALERALLHRPRLVLLDEPFTGLDDTSAEALMARLGDVARAGAIVVMAVHDVDRAERAATRHLCLTRGVCEELHAGGAPLLERYRAIVTRGAAPVEALR